MKKREAFVLLVDAENGVIVLRRFPTTLQNESSDVDV